MVRARQQADFLISWDGDETRELEDKTNITGAEAWAADNACCYRTSMTV
jgi:hypothetical protein